MFRIHPIFLATLLAACGSSSSSGRETELDPSVLEAARSACAEPVAQAIALPAEPEPPGPDAPLLGVPPDIAIPDVVAAQLSDLPDESDVDAFIEELGIDRAQSVSTAAALANPSGAVVKVCDRAYVEDADFVSGCMLARSCRYYLQTESGVVEVSDQAELAAAIGPIETDAAALGMVALTDRNVFVPISEAEQARLDEIADFYGWQAYDTEVPAISVEPVDWGFIVRVPAYPMCGCHHHLVRVAYQVMRDGQVCRLDEPVVPLAHSHIAICVD